MDMTELDRLRTESTMRREEWMHARDILGEEDPAVQELFVCFVMARDAADRAVIRHIEEMDHD